MAVTPASLDETATFTRWWAGAWRQSQSVDARVVARYAAIRLQLMERNPILRTAAGPPSNTSQSSHFFIEVGAASGPPGRRHQVEFPESIVGFFGRAMRRRRDLTLRCNGSVWRDRPLSYKVTTFGVRIWRLGMPTQTNGGEPIAHRAIRFTRTVDPRLFEFEVADLGSRRVIEWERAANQNGHLGTTQGQHPRLYGFY
jgi:hypothetical protein